MGYNRDTTKNKSKKIALMAMLFVMAMVLSFVESMLTAGLSLPLGIKPGLSNIITMYCLFFLGKKGAYTLAFLKAFFAFLTRGATAGMLSLVGGLASITIMIILLLPKKHSVSYTLLSIAGAVTHNLSQIVLASFILGMGYKVAVGLAPLLLITGIAMGILTGFILRLVLPALEKLGITMRK